ncbi:MAG: 16S rRNA (cytosine(1402)-N(4))-methyltransferase RsmH [Candidatus Paceibacterota bacterium]|jgi:16S rRNA (cytosine1402-N4)-methyltransferase
MSQFKDNSEHIPVLLQETIDGLNLKLGQTVVDATLGRGGHTCEISKKIGTSGWLIGLDADEQNVNDVKDFLGALECKTTLKIGNFRDIKNTLEIVGTKPGEVDRFLFDLGLNSVQLESSGRGFSFQINEPLVMTLERNPGENVLTARVIVNEWSEESLEAILRGFGGEQFSGRIARVIVEERKHKKILTTFDLVEIIEKAVPEFYKHRKIHFATKTFQALRIAVNDEFGSVVIALGSAWDYLAPSGRIAVITFHDGEDRIVKKKFIDFKKRGGVIITKKVIAPTQTEVKKNPRARSAKLRIIEKVS